MTSKIHFPDENIVGIEVSGKLSKPSFVQMMQRIIPETNTPPHFNIYIEVKNFDGLDWEVVWDSLKYAISEGGKYFKKVDKIAFVADKGWLRFLASAEYKLIPAIELKSFEFSEKEEAKRWLREG